MSSSPRPWNPVQPGDDPLQPGNAELYDEAPCGLLVTAPDGTIQRVNHTFCRWVEMDAPELVGKRRFQDLLSMGGRIFHQTHLMPLLQMQGSVAEVKLDLRTRSGPTIPIMVNAVRRATNGVVHDAIAVFMAKERHSYERELMRSRERAEELARRQLEIQEELRDADRRKDEFLAMLAHELRNPLAPIAMSAEVLRIAADDPRRVQQVGEVISRQIGHLTNLVDDLLDVSRVTRGLVELELESIDLADIVDAAVEQTRTLFDGRAHHLELRAPRGVATVAGDRTRLVQITANLLNNAAKYTPPGGRITIELEAQAGEARLTVADTGIGIDASLLPRVFELFSQAERTPDRSQGGLGIGLALVRSLVALHGGRVDAYSDGPHCGSRFVIHLPLVGQVAMETGAPAPASAGTADALRVLVVDDNVDAASMLAEVIRLGGHAVDISNSAQDALDRVRRDAPPDVFILDIGLPEMTGLELADRVRQALPGRPFLLIALTGYGQPHDRVMTRAAGFDHHLVKPADVSVLLGILDAHARANPRLRAREQAFD